MTREWKKKEKRCNQSAGSVTDRSPIHDEYERTRSKEQTKRSIYLYRPCARPSYDVNEAGFPKRKGTVEGLKGHDNSTWDVLPTSPGPRPSPRLHWLAAAQSKRMSRRPETRGNGWPRLTARQPLDSSSNTRGFRRAAHHEIFIASSTEAVGVSE